MLEQNIFISSPQMAGEGSMATILRQERVREDCISFTARMDRRYRHVYTLAPLKRLRQHFHRRKLSTIPRTQVTVRSGASGPQTAKGHGTQPDHGGAAPGVSTPQSTSGDLPLNKARKSLKDTILELKPSPGKEPVKRKVMRPDLDAYVANFTKEQQAMFEQKVAQKMDEMTDMLKEKYRQKKAAFDERAIFHPHANAQRVHTMFMVELQRRLNPEAIEDAVLDDMKAAVNRVKEDERKKELKELLDGLFLHSHAYQRAKINLPSSPSSSSQHVDPASIEGRAQTAPTTQAPGDKTRKRPATREQRNQGSSGSSRRSRAKSLPDQRRIARAKAGSPARRSGHHHQVSMGGSGPVEEGQATPTFTAVGPCPSVDSFDGGTLHTDKADDPRRRNSHRREPSAVHAPIQPPSVSGSDADGVAQHVEHRAIHRLLNEDPRFMDFVKLQEQKAKREASERPASRQSDMEPVEPQGPHLEALYEAIPGLARHKAHVRKLIGSDFLCRKLCCSRLQRTVLDPELGLGNEFATCSHHSVPSSPLHLHGSGQSGGSVNEFLSAFSPPGSAEDGASVHNSVGEYSRQSGSGSSGNSRPSKSSSRSDRWTKGSSGEQAEGDVQAQIERVLHDLKMPTTQRLSFLEKYCDAMALTALPEVLCVWERATELILVREALLAAQRDEEKLPGRMDPADDAALDIEEMARAVLPPSKQALVQKADYWLDPGAFWATFHAAHTANHPTFGSVTTEQPQGPSLSSTTSGYTETTPIPPDKVEMLQSSTILPSTTVSVGLKRRCVIAWIGTLLKRVTGDLNVVLKQINSEYHDDVTYKGKSYLKILGLRPGKS